MPTKISIQRQSNKRDFTVPGQVGIENRKKLGKNLLTGWIYSQWSHWSILGTPHKPKNGMQTKMNFSTAQQNQVRAMQAEQVKLATKVTYTIGQHETTFSIRVVDFHRSRQVRQQITITLLKCVTHKIKEQAKAFPRGKKLSDRGRRQTVLKHCSWGRLSKQQLGSSCGLLILAISKTT